MQNNPQGSSNLSWSPLLNGIVARMPKNPLLYLVSPFIRLDALQNLFSCLHHDSQTQIITRWNADDIVSGVSDLEVYPWLKERGIKLYIHKRIHLKLFLFESNEIFHCSGNVSNNGLGINGEGNIEVGAYVNSSLNDWRQLYRLIDDSLLVTDEVYEKAVAYKENNVNINEPLPELDLFESIANGQSSNHDVDLINKPYSMGALPALESPEKLFELYSKDSLSGISPADARLLFHDLALFNIDNLDMELDQLTEEMKTNIKQLPFIVDFINYLQREKSLRFGAVTSWIHDKCTDVPLPYRKEIKEHVNHLYNWLEFAYDEVTWSIPGARSQVIFWNHSYSIPPIELPFYPDLEVACGVFQDGISAEFTKEFIEVENRHGNLDPERHFVVRASGDSMDGGNNPIKDGDLLLLEVNVGGAISNQVFAVGYQDEFGNMSYVLKRIEKLPDGSYHLVSSNKKYPPISVDPATMKPFARLKSLIVKDNNFSTHHKR